MSLKSQFESHPVVWGLSLLAIGFTAGFSARAYLLPSAASNASPTICNAIGAEALATGHNTRLQQLQSALSNLESQASDQGNIEAYQERYRASADRIRKDIEQETNSFNASVAALTEKCAV